MDLFLSEPMKIGKTFWRIAVRHFDYLKANCTVYEWSKDGQTWNNYREWHDYDFNRQWGPKGLTALYHKNLPMFSWLVKRA